MPLAQTAHLYPRPRRVCGSPHSGAQSSGAAQPRNLAVCQRQGRPCPTPWPRNRAAPGHGPVRQHGTRAHRYRACNVDAPRSKHHPHTPTQTRARRNTCPHMHTGTHTCMYTRTRAGVHATMHTACRPGTTRALIRAPGVEQRMRRRRAPLANHRRTTPTKRRVHELGNNATTCGLAADTAAPRHHIWRLVAQYHTVRLFA